MVGSINKVILGGEKNKLYNPVVESTFGDVSVMSASGTVSIQTIKADVSFTNTDASNIKLLVGGELTAKKLLGAVEVSVDGSADIQFEQFTQNSTITGTNANALISVSLLNNDGNSFAYNLEGNDASLFEYNIDDPENHYQINKSTSIISPVEMVGRPLLKVSAEGRLVVYYKKTN